MTYVFDIDGTICTLTDGDYNNAKPFKEKIKKINNLHKKGHNIVYFTARGMGRFHGNAFKAHNDFHDLTERQLKKWGAKYHKLILGKPSGDFYIDDKGIKADDFFADDSR